MAAMLRRSAFGPAFALVVALLACGLGPITARAQDALPAAVQAALAAAGVPADALAAVALPLGHATPAWGHRAQALMQPGSTMKLVTSIVALDRLGPNLRGTTELRSAAALQAGVLQGDLVLRGGADPELGVAQFWALLLDLRQRGVQHIAGDLLLDRTLFRPARFDLGLPPFDDAPEFPYNVIPDALFLAGNLLPIELQSGPDGVQASTVPALPGLALTSRMALTDTPCADWDAGWKPATVSRVGGDTLIELQGAFPRNCTQRVALQLVDRNELAGRLFRGLWQGLGGTWAGQVREAAAPEGTQVLARHDARPWGEVLRHMNKTSDNAQARLLYLLLGVPAMAANPQASTFELAEREVRAWLAENGIDAHGIVLDNGSGLSRSERISPWQLARMLQVAWQGRHASDLMMSLPTAGVDGTLRRRLKDSPAAGWARLKTGTLRDVVGLAGYVNDAQGRPWAVAMMVNHQQAERARPVLDALVDHIARRGPAAGIAVPALPIWAGPGNAPF